jgi:protein gp37
MSDSSRIEWTQATWNPVAGCNVLSPGCTNCYAMRMAARLAAMGQDKYIGTTRKSGGRAKWTGKISLDEASLELPQKWKRGRLIFVNSMADLFHDKVPAAYVRKVFDAMAVAPQHTFQVLTKRPERMLALSPTLPWASHIWMGVSVESADYTCRIDLLRQSGAAVKFLSLEPLLGPLDDLDLRGIDWVIAGGESGPGARPMEQQWVRSIRDQCRAAEVAFHFKQWGGTNKKRAGRNLDGRTWDDLPGFRANALPHAAAAE